MSQSLEADHGPEQYYANMLGLEPWQQQDIFAGEVVLAEGLNTLVASPNGQTIDEVDEAFRKQALFIGRRLLISQTRQSDEGPDLGALSDLNRRTLEHHLFGLSPGVAAPDVPQGTLTQVNMRLVYPQHLSGQLLADKNAESRHKLLQEEPSVAVELAGKVTGLSRTREIARLSVGAMFGFYRTKTKETRVVTRWTRPQFNRLTPDPRLHMPIGEVKSITGDLGFNEQRNKSG